MSPEGNFPGSAADWLRYAHSDLELARIPRHPQVLLETLCFHAQQAAEKAFKDVLIANQIPFPRTHNLRTLFDLLPANRDAPAKVQEGIILTEYAVSSRYPGDFEPIDDEEYRIAVQLAETIVHWAEMTIEELGSN